MKTTDLFLAISQLFQAKLEEFEEKADNKYQKVFNDEHT
jgi:hypothetical protein